MTDPVLHASPGEPAAWPPATPPRRRRRPLWLHASLLGVTFLTLAYAGGFFWEGVGAEVSTWSELVDPGVALRAVGAGLPYALWVVAILGAHEMGHFLACVRYRIPATLPFFIPGPPPLGSFGAVIRIRGRIPDRRALFDVAAAGPIAGFAVALPALLLGILGAEPSVEAPPPGGFSMGAPVLWMLIGDLWPHDAPPQVNYLIGAGWVGMLVTSLNLFPVGQLDGGHAAYAISRRLHRLTAHGAVLLLLVAIVFQGFVQRQVPAYVVWFAILLWMRDRHPRLVDETAPLGIGRVLVGVGLLVLFVLSFIPVPLIVHDA